MSELVKLVINNSFSFKVMLDVHYDSSVRSSHSALSVSLLMYL